MSSRAEIEEGELDSSDQEDNVGMRRRRSKAKVVASSDREDGECDNDDNSIDTLDATIIRLKMKALKSLLKEQKSNRENTESGDGVAGSSNGSESITMASQEDQDVIWLDGDKPNASNSTYKPFYKKKPLKSKRFQSVQKTRPFTGNRYQPQNTEIEEIEITSSSSSSSTYLADKGPHGYGASQYYQQQQSRYQNNSYLQANAIQSSLLHSWFSQIMSVGPNALPINPFPSLMAMSLMPPPLQPPIPSQNYSNKQPYTSRHHETRQPQSSKFPRSSGFANNFNKMGKVVKKKKNPTNFRFAPVNTNPNANEKKLASPVVSEPSVSTSSVVSLTPESSSATSVLFDVDERFLDKTTSSSDVDYRQLETANSTSSSQSVTTIVDSSQEEIIQTQSDIIEIKLKEIAREVEAFNQQQQKELAESQMEIEKQQVSPAATEETTKSVEQNQEDEEEMNKMRSRLLDTMKKKRLLKERLEQEQESLRQQLMQEKLEREQANLLEKQKSEEKENNMKQQHIEKQMYDDISMFRQRLAEHEQLIMSKTSLSKETEASANANNRPAPTRGVSLVVRKIAPIIIQINPREELADSSDDDDEDHDRPVTRAQKIPPVAVVDNPVKTTNLPQLKISVSTSQPAKNSVAQYELDKNESVKSLRDKINLKTKTIKDLNSKLVEVDKNMNKKENDIESTRSKITMLREQLQVAEKILAVNEQSLDELKSQKRALDSRITKLQNMKKVQQQHLQDILNPSKTIESKNPVSVTQPSPPLQRTMSPATPSVPKLPLPSLPPVPQLSLPFSTQSSASTESNRQSAETVADWKPINMTLGEEMASTLKNQPKTPAPVLSTTRPNLYVSKQTDEKLEKIATMQENERATNSVSSVQHESIVVDAKVVNVSKGKKATKSQQKKNDPGVFDNQLAISKEKSKKELLNRQKLNLILENLTRDYPYCHHDSFDIWSNEFILKHAASMSTTIELKPKFKLSEMLENGGDANSTKLAVNQTLTTANYFDVIDYKDLNVTKTHESNKVYVIDDVANYQSPLRVFRGYRFSSNFEKLNEFEEAYSKFYCHTIDFRRPFCPYDMHGSCKDSNCIYQHSNVMTMDNFQRTEHFLSYAPQLLELSSDKPSQKEAIKKLKLYAKNFMGQHLNRMSIKDYFKFLYDHVAGNLNLDLNHSTVLSRSSVFCLNNNKTIGVYSSSDVPESSNENGSPNSKQSIKSPPANKSNSSVVEVMLNQILEANMRRALDMTLKNLLVNQKLELAWLTNNNKLLNDQANDVDLDLEFFMNKDDLIVAWMFLARQVYNTTSVQSNKVEKLLNVLSNTLEQNPNCELVWLVYLKCYLEKKNSLNDYHEICMLCMDNLITYDLVWFILITCPLQHMDLVLERYEKYLLTEGSTKLAEFEQTSDQETTTATSKKVSFYLTEIILHHVYVKMATQSISLVEGREEMEERCLEARRVFKSYFQRAEITANLEPIDLVLLWLAYTHLETFFHLPNWININKHEYLIDHNRSIDFKSFWLLQDEKRSFNRPFFKQVNSIYANRYALLNNDQARSQILRHYDLFLMPWPQQQQSANQSFEKIQGLLHEGLKVIHSKCSSNGTYSKQEIRLFSLPLFLNMIHLAQVSSKLDVGVKLCDRLLKDTKFYRELWFSLLNLQLLAAKVDKNYETIEATMQNCLEIFLDDVQLVFLTAQFYSIKDKDRSIKLIESFVAKQNPESVDLSSGFSKLLDAANATKASDSERSLFYLSVCYCYYKQLRGEDHVQISADYERLVHRLGIVQNKTAFWIRYLKYLHGAMEATSAEEVKRVVRASLTDLNTQSTQVWRVSRNLIVPFDQIDSIDHSSSGYKVNGSSTNRADWNEENFVDAASVTASFSYYYQNCLIDVILRLFATSVADKHALAKYILEHIMPLNSGLVKIVVAHGIKLNGLHKTLQYLYDHLCINNICDERLWVFCVKLCLDMNDMQQAMLIYHKAESMCIDYKPALLELKQLESYLFPSSSS